MFWDLVLNNYTDEECENVKATFEEICEAYIIGKEKGSENGTPHLQMCIKLFKGKEKSWLIKRMGHRVSMRPGRNMVAMRNYCLKDDIIYAKKNVEAIKLEKKVKLSKEEYIKKKFDCEKYNREELYNKFIEEADKNMEGYEWLKAHLLKNIDEKDYWKKNNNGYDSE